MPQYYALALLEPRKEFEFQYELKRNKVHCYIPVVKKPVSIRGRKAIKTVPLFSGYAFVLMKNYDDEYSVVQKARGFRKFFAVDGEVVRIRKRSVWDLKNREQKGEFSVVQGLENVVFKRGEYVRIGDGAFQSYLGVISDFVMKAGKPCVVLSVKTMKITISLAVLEKIGH